MTLLAVPEAVIALVDQRAPQIPDPLRQLVGGRITVPLVDRREHRALSGDVELDRACRADGLKALDRALRIVGFTEPLEQLLPSVPGDHDVSSLAREQNCDAVETLGHLARAYNGAAA